MVHKHCQNTAAGRSGYKAVIVMPDEDFYIRQPNPPQSRQDHSIPSPIDLSMFEAGKTESKPPMAAKPTVDLTQFQ